VLSCIGVLPEFYAQPAASFERLTAGFFRAFDRLGERFGIRVLGTLDDVWLLMGPSLTYPWTCYILAAAPSYDAVHQVTRPLMEVEVDGDWLWRYAKLEARVGHRWTSATSRPTGVVAGSRLPRAGSSRPSLNDGNARLTRHL
jgi:hypothetical protein